MIIFKDKLPGAELEEGERPEGDELASDTFPYTEEHGVVYKFKCKQVTYSTEISDDLIGGNASAEEAAEGNEASCQSGINLILNHRLVETAMKKKEYTAHIKDYMKRVKVRLEEDKESSEEVAAFAKGCQAFVKEVLDKENFPEYQFFIGENMSAEGMTVLCKWDGETPYVYMFKHGLISEKV